MSEHLSIWVIAYRLDTVGEKLIPIINELKQQHPGKPFPEPVGLHYGKNIYDLDEVVNWLGELRPEICARIQFNRMAKQFIQGKFKPSIQHD